MDRIDKKNRFILSLKTQAKIIKRLSYDGYQRSSTSDYRQLKNMGWNASVHPFGRCTGDRLLQKSSSETVLWSIG